MKIIQIDKRPTLTEKQKEVLNTFMMFECMFNEVGIPPRLVSDFLEYKESGPIYGSIKALIKKGYLEKIVGENRKKVRYRSL